MRWSCPPRAGGDGWAFGREGHALDGKRCLWAVTTGGDEHAYSAAGSHGHSFETFVPAFRQIAVLCRMRFEAPFVVRGARKLNQQQLLAEADRYCEALRALVAEVRDA